MPQIDPFLLQIAEHKRAQASSSAVAPPDNILEWAERYRRLEGQKFSLDRFKPLKAIYLDDHRRLVIKKPAQRGVSEFAVSFTCFALELGAKKWAKGLKNGLNVGYLFPVKQDLEDFAKERINELREESTHLAILFSDEQFDSLGFKKVGSSHLYMRGAYAKTGLLSFPADVLIFDEFDRMDSKAIAMATRRMSASPVRRDIRISTPTYPGMGISKAYMESDQRIWQTPCPHCREYISFDFFRDVYVDDQPYEAWKHWSQDHIITSTVALHCPKCHGLVDDEQRCADGRWFVQKPENQRVHGYHIPWWAFPQAEIAEFVFDAVSETPDDIEELNRSDLGLEYGAGGGSVTEQMLRQLTAEYPTNVAEVRWRNTTLGCDIGSRLHYRVSSEDMNGIVHVRDMGSIEGGPEHHWEGLSHLMLRYQVRMAIVDAQPEWHESLAFCKRWHGRAMRAFYPTNAASLKGTLFHEKRNSVLVSGKRKRVNQSATEEYDIQINRKMAMDLVLSTISHAHERWPMSIVTDQEVIDHMIAPTRVAVSDDTGQQDHDWIHTKPDHGFHASVYDMIARMVLPNEQKAAPSVGGESRVALASAYVQNVGRERSLDQMYGLKRSQSIY